MKMNEYENLLLEVVHFESIDVITNDSCTTHCADNSGGVECPPDI